MPPLDPPRLDAIRIRGARQNNLKNLDLDLPLNALIVVTGVSGSGKSSLVFDTLYAEGQRRYVETFSPYARLFLDRMDKPAVDAIDGIPPAIAIDQLNPVRTSRSTVGTMTEINDHLKLLFAKTARLHCRGCGAAVRRDTAASITLSLQERARSAGDPRLVLTFPVTVPGNFSDAEVEALLARQGYARVHTRSRDRLEVIQDRFRIGSVDSSRIADAVEAALRYGEGRLNVYPEATGGAAIAPWRYSTGLHCADCDLTYKEPSPSTFSFNSPIGACETCKGFGRLIGIDYDLVIPDASLSLADGAIKPWQTESNRECQTDLMRFARKRGIAVDVPWRELPPATRAWVIDGEGEWKKGVWYGVRRFFAWLETKAYKMHIRVLLSRYRSYTECPACQGARLKPDALLWRLGDPGRTLAELMLLPIDRCRLFFAELRLPAPLDEAAQLVLGEIRTRLGFLCEVGLGYLSLDRQSRTLSGGEVQRINLTTALGTSLVNTLFVLDEPSIGLHARDVDRIVAIMRRLRDAGNTLVVVEHDPKVMQAADRLLDLGPGPGERGGEIVFYGPFSALRTATHSLTADYLLQRRHVDGGDHAPTAPDGAQLRIVGAKEHNLKNVNVAIPLGRLVCVTGVSGSGKSTLIHDILYRGLLRALGRPTDNPGAHEQLQGADLIDTVIMVDQSPIGRTTRSNPASYIGVFDAIRALFAQLPESRARKYTAGTFSFNAGTGRCPSCGGNGFEHVEMQFLSDVYLRCAECNGSRFRREILECRLATPGFAHKSIAEVLDLTVAEALGFFAAEPQIVARLDVLADVGLDYLRLGQAVPTLSGGEAQRLKLAAHLAAEVAGERNARRRGAQKRSAARGAAAGSVATVGAAPEAAAVKRGTLFLFDEPTTGLHVDDISKLLRTFRRLVAAGHSLLVIEHNLEVVRAADWLIDLGPEGGDAGGSVVCVGTPHEVMAEPASHTGRALREAAGALREGGGVLRESSGALREGGGALPEGGAVREGGAPREAGGVLREAGAPVASWYVAQGQTAPGESGAAGRLGIDIRGAREHNLKDIDVFFGRGEFTVLTGVSGSGKSTLAFDILFAEGQRRYLESLNAYARQFVQPAARPDVDAIYGIPPTVAIEQRTSRGGQKSTVATLTEIYHFLRLLFVKLGTPHCPDCQVPIEPQSEDAIVARLLEEYRGTSIQLLAPLVVARKGLYTTLAKWARAKGFAQMRVDGEFQPTAQWPRLDRFVEHDIELPIASLSVSAQAETALRAAVHSALEYGRGVVTVLGIPTQRSFSTKRACSSCARSFAELDPRLFSFNSKHGWCPGCFGTGLELPEFDAEQTGEEPGWREHPRGTGESCPRCAGRRLNPTALAVLFRGESIASVTNRSVREFSDYLSALTLSGRELEIARDLLAELKSRSAFLQDVGLGYLTLERAAPTLSGGEAQRIRLAAQLGSNLTGVCYVLDEPTIGLHPRDNQALLRTLDRLRVKGNTLVVVEHDEDTIRRADRVIDLGPGAGSRGGCVVAQGTAEELARNADSVTGRCLAAPLVHSRTGQRAVDAGLPSLEIVGATLHNLRKVDARIPLGRLSVITGVSGSGKSSLARDVLLTNLKRLAGTTRTRKARPALDGCAEIRGWQRVTRVLEVDQTPIGRTPRSCPATYIGFWDSIRNLFAETTAARVRGFGASRFSFNTAGGRCGACEGQGVQRVEMNFLPDVQVVCDVCKGRRFETDTSSVTYRGKNVGEVLAMSVDEALPFFAAHRSVHHALELLSSVGLGYLCLGQASPTLSGGESQRIKLVAELAKARTDGPGVDAMRRDGQHTVYVLDEPTVGLHMADVEKLLAVLHRLVDAGNTCVVIEHNLDVMAEADWLVDLGPEGGQGGGCVVAQGPPAEIARKSVRSSHTARFLRGFLAARGIA